MFPPRIFGVLAMNMGRFIGALLVIVFGVFGSQKAQALEILDFDKPIPPTAQLLISDFVTANLHMNMENYQAAEMDLNRDSLSEYILRQKKCYGDEKLCTFLILAESRGNIVLLGKFSARNLALGNSYSFGVQDILAFQSNNNDYGYDIFVWDPPTKMYILKKQTAG